MYNITLRRLTSLLFSVLAMVGVSFAQVVINPTPVPIETTPITPPPPVTIPPITATLSDPLVIASIGDSNAAGEGTPNTEGSAASIWTLAPCHRSEKNGRTLAAIALGKLTDVEYGDFSCSGGSINTGLLGPYVGLPVNGLFGDAMPAQIQQVKDWMNRSARRQHLDVLIVSIGVNDSGFGRVVGTCLRPVEDCSKDAQLSSIITNGDPDNATVVLGINRLPAALDQLAAAIKDQLNPTYVLITEYPNPVHDQKDFFCNGYDEHFEVAPTHLTWGNIEPVTGILKWLRIGGSMREVRSYESEFLESSLLEPLNRELRNAATRHRSDGWRYVAGATEMSRPHGYCAKTSWFNTLKASFQTQGDVDGTAHLNKAGQKLYQWLLQKRIIELFGLSKAPPIEVFDVQVTHEYIGDRKRIVVEISPTVHFVTGEIQYKLRTTDMAAMIQASSAPLVKDTSFTTRQVYYADLPGTETLLYGESFHYRPVLHYGRQQDNLDGVFIGTVREYQVFRYQTVSDE